MRITIIGANGQLASDLIPRLERDGHEITGLAHAQVEVTDAASVGRVVSAANPDVVVNTSAYHKVDEVESEPNRAFAVNASGPLHLARACREAGAALVHISTDYVFSGEGRGPDEPYSETEPIDPPNVYGVSKAAGELAVRSVLPRHLIVRSSGLYGLAGASGKGGNFVETMLRLAGDPDRAIRVVDDQCLTPTSTRALADQIAHLLTTDEVGTVHATCQGECTWYEFAAEIFSLSGLAPDLSTQTTAESGATASRPSYSVLDNAALRNAGCDRLPHWRDALAAYLDERKAAGRDASGTSTS